jgi:hypothetical protein
MFIIQSDWLLGTIHEIFKWFDAYDMNMIAQKLSCFFSDWETNSTHYLLNLKTMTWKEAETGKLVKGDYPYKGISLYRYFPCL